MHLDGAGMLRPPRLARAVPRRRPPARALALLPCVARLAKMPSAADVWEAHSRKPLPIIQAAKAKQKREVKEETEVVPDSVPGASKANFSRIYAREEWDGEALSGLGSREETTREFRRFLEDFLQERGISSVVDAGCGHWPSGYQRFMEWHQVVYTGVDVVPYVVEENARYFQNPATLESHGLSSAQFMCGDVSESLPSADLLLVKDVLMHLPNRAVHEFLKNSFSDASCSPYTSKDSKTRSVAQRPSDRGPFVKGPKNGTCVKMRWHSAALFYLADLCLLVATRDDIFWLPNLKLKRVARIKNRSRYLLGNRKHSGFKARILRA